MGDFSMYKVKLENGYYLFKLQDLLKSRHISINRFMKDTDTDFKVIKRIMKGDLVGFDILVLARFCDYLNCTLTDIIEYVPNSK